MLNLATRYNVGPLSNYSGSQTLQLSLGIFSLVCTCMSFVCHSYVLVCHPYVTRMYSMSPVCHSYVLVCHPYVTRMNSNVIRMSLVCIRMSSISHSYVVLPWTFISEGGRLISDILEITNSLQIDRLLMTIDIEKAFDSVNKFFLRIQ